MTITKAAGGVISLALFRGVHRMLAGKNALRRRDLMTWVITVLSVCGVIWAAYMLTQAFLQAISD
jgi:hypothetical protein